MTRSLNTTKREQLLLEYLRNFNLCPIDKGSKEARDVMLIRNTFYRRRNAGRKTERGR
jgi:hypothetical protein